MKAKRIVSILLTGSMLLSLLPVSALAAAPVFDAPAQTTTKKAVPLVQEADASRSTEEEASTRSSRDLDAENGTAESITIQLNADGTPAGYGDGEHWYYSAASGCQLDTGVFALQPSSEAEAESALKARLFHIGDNAELVRGTVGCETINYGTIFDGIFQGKVTNFRTISGGTFQGGVNNFGTISNGTFQREVDNCGTISNGTFQQPVYNYRTISGGIFEEVVKMNESTEGAKIEGGTFKKGIELNAYYPTITDGLFDGKVSAAEGYSGTLSISGGYFVNKPTLREGSGIAFTSVSDQDGRTFQVPVNRGWSENNYNELYVPSGSSEQPNTITVKTAAPLTDCLADGVSIMGTDKVRKNDDGSYAIDVYSPAPIVLVTEEPAPPTPGEPDFPDTTDTGTAIGVGVTSGVLIGGAAYLVGTQVWMELNLPDGVIPTNRQQLAMMLWKAAEQPQPQSTALYADIDADNTDAQQAARWCVEQGLMKDYGADFKPGRYTFRPQVIKAWYDLQHTLKAE